MIQGSPGQGSGPQTPGFLTIPGGVFTAATDAGDGKYYDKPLQKWVPGGPSGISPDGTFYAYPEFLTPTKTSRVHVVDVQSGRDRILATGGPWLGVGVDSNAVYVIRIEFIDSAAYGSLEIDKGLWKIPLDGTESTQLTNDSRNWAWIAGGGVYGDRFSGDVAGGPNDIVRFDLKTTQSTVWFAPGMRSRVLAVDGTGAALVITEADDEEIWRVTGPGNAIKVWSGPLDGMRPDGQVAVDGTDVWLTGASFARAWAIFHFAPGGGMQQVATFTDRPISVAGPCA